MVCQLFSHLKEMYTLYTRCKINHTRQSATLPHISQTNVSGCNSIDGEHMKQNETSLYKLLHIGHLSSHQQYQIHPCI